MHGLKEIVMYLHTLPPHKKNVPDIIPQAIKLITDVRDLVQIHRKDNPNMAVTGRCILRLEVIIALFSKTFLHCQKFAIKIFNFLKF